MTRTKQNPVLVLVFSLLPFLLGHGDSSCGGDEEIDFGPPTETICTPEGEMLTYENFGRPFMESYCLRCHSTNVSGSERRGAPSDHNFDTKFEAIALKDHIDWMAGAGPGAVNEGMPPDGSTPTLEERKNLSQWLACDSL